MITDAGAEGAKVTVWGDTLDLDDELATAYADMLNTIGLDATPKILDGGVYFQTIGNSKTEAQTGAITGSRTSHTRRTSSSWWTANRSSRPTTRTPATWTIPRSTPGSPS